MTDRVSTRGSSLGRWLVLVAVCALLGGAAVAALAWFILSGSPPEGDDEPSGESEEKAPSVTEYDPSAEPGAFPAGIGDVCYGPEGDRIFYVQRFERPIDIGSDELHCWDTDSDRVYVLVEDTQNDPSLHLFSLSPEGDRLAVAREDASGPTSVRTNLLVFDTESLEMVASIPLSGALGADRHSGWSADGREFWYSDFFGVYAVDIDTEEARELAPTGFWGLGFSPDGEFLYQPDTGAYAGTELLGEGGRAWATFDSGSLDQLLFDGEDVFYAVSLKADNTTEIGVVEAGGTTRVVWTDNTGRAMVTRMVWEVPGETILFSMSGLIDDRLGRLDVESGSYEELESVSGRGDWDYHPATRTIAFSPGQYEGLTERELE